MKKIEKWKVVKIVEENNRVLLYRDDTYYAIASSGCSVTVGEEILCEVEHGAVNFGWFLMRA